MPIGGFHFLGLHHPVPAADKIGAVIIKTDPLPRRTPGGVLRGPPFLHVFITVGTLRRFFSIHRCLLFICCLSSIIYHSPMLNDQCSMFLFKILLFDTRGKDNKWPKHHVSPFGEGDLEHQHRNSDHQMQHVDDIGRHGPIQ